MNETEILEHFRGLPLAEKHEAVQLIHAEFGKKMSAEYLAKFEQTVKEVRRHPETGMIWKQVSAKLRKRAGK